MSYRNCVYDSRTQSMRLFTWDENGKRVQYTTSYNPYLYVEDPAGEKTSIYKTKVKKKVFKTNYERIKFVQEAGIKRLFEFISPVQQFLIDVYWRDNQKDEFTKHPLKINFIDIETYSPSSQGFPNPDDPTHPVNVITCYDSFSEKYYTFGTKPFTGKDDNIIYTHCKNERDLFIKFIEYIQDDYPDIISGWNSIGFDMPYIVNRCEKILGQEYVNKLSPVGRVSFRTFTNNFGKNVKQYILEGVSCIDYLDIYRKFCGKLRESYRLDAIAEIELQENKLDYGDIDLATLADTDWNKFIEYNIHDVRLLVMLEEKLQYISLLRMLAYVGLTTFEGSLGSISLLTGAMAIKARTKGEVVSTFVRSRTPGINPGAYVSEPSSGLRSYIATFDAASLYPSIMMSLNMSPETKIGKFEKNERGNVNIYHISGKTIELTPEKFKVFIKHEECAISKANVLFSQKRRGIVPEFLDDYFTKRMEVKKEMRETDKKIESVEENSPEYFALKDEAKRLDTKQLVIKILINSLYGMFGNKVAPLGDDDIASSVTLTGQYIIKQSNDIIKGFMIDELGLSDREEINDIIIYNDTDSCFITLEPYIKRNKFDFVHGNVLTQEVYDKLAQIENHLNTTINKWSQRVLRSKDPRFNFKREKICWTGVFLKKKRYVIRILDNEGKRMDKYKYTGVEVVRTTMPNAIKPYAKKIIETMLGTQTQVETNKVLNETYDIFKSLPIEDIAFVRGMRGYEKYAPKCDGFNIGKKTPIHIKAAYIHNTLNKMLGIDKKYETINSGDKVRFFYPQQPNKYGVDVIGFKHTFPEEYKDIFKIDYDKMFDKILFSSIESFYECVKWQVRKPSESVQTELFDLFG